MDHDQLVGVLEILNTAKAKQFDQSDLELLNGIWIVRLGGIEECRIVGPPCEMRVRY